MGQRGDEWRRASVSICFALLGLAFFPLPASAQAPRGTVVLDIQTTEPGLEDLAFSVGLHLRSDLAFGKKRYSWRQLSDAAASVSSNDGQAGGLSVPPKDLPKLAKEINCNRIISGTLATKGGRLHLQLYSTAHNGKTKAVPAITGPPGMIVPLINRALERLGGDQGQIVVKGPRISAAELQPFRAAQSGLLAKDYAKAVRALEASPPSASRSQAAVDIARTVWSAEAADADDRLLAAMSVEYWPAAKRVSKTILKNNKSSELASAAMLRAALATSDAKSAKKYSKKLKHPKSEAGLLASAIYAYRYDDERSLKKKLGKLIRSERYLPAFAASLAIKPGALGKDLEASLATKSIELYKDHPGLALLVAKRAALSGQPQAVQSIGLDLASIDTGNADELEALAAALREKAPLSAALLEIDQTIAVGDIKSAQSMLRSAQSQLVASDADKAAIQARLAMLEPLAKEPEQEEGAGALAAKDAHLTPEVDGLAGPSEELQSELDAMLQAFPDLEERRLKRILLAPLDGNISFVLAPRQADPGMLERGLAQTLSGPSYRKTIQGKSAQLFPEPLKIEKLLEEADKYKANAVLLYGLTTKGKHAEVKLVLFDAKARSAQEVQNELPGISLGLVHWNMRFLVAVACLLLLLILWGVYTLVRPRGSVSARIKLDSSSQKEALYLCLSKKRNITPPSREELIKRGHKEGQREVSQPSAFTQLSRVPIGSYWLHLRGTVEKDGEIQSIGELSEKIRVRRKQNTAHSFDLEPKAALHIIRVLDNDGPAKELKAWLGDDDNHSHGGDAEGTIRIEVPKGQHALKIKHKDLTVERNLFVMDMSTQHLTIHLERERQLGLHAGGIPLADVEPSQVEIERNEPKLAAGSANPTLATDATSMGTGAVAVSLGTGSDPQMQRYVPQQELGRGAMGVVMKAHDKVLERTVALKMMTKELEDHPVAMKMFLQEAKAMAALNHPNIVTVYDQGTHDHQAFMVMEFVEGQTLEDLLESKSPLSLKAAAQIFDQLCAGLSYAHKQRIIHRDIKPANIFIAKNGTIKVGDFGLARAIKEVSIKKTEIKGTPLYMAPEQIMGAEIDFRADIYALGCTLYEMLTGAPPFVEGEILYHHLHTEPDAPSSKRPGLSAAMDSLILRCIAKDKERRFASCDQLRSSLRQMFKAR